VVGEDVVDADAEDAGDAKGQFLRAGAVHSLQNEPSSGGSWAALQGLDFALNGGSADTAPEVDQPLPIG
jgi:hypothetical protein